LIHECIWLILLYKYVFGLLLCIKTS